MISVVVANYNGAAFLGAALDSVLAQDYEDFELVVVDDGSTDASPRILSEYAARDARIRLLLESENCGQGVAFNTGVAAAQGDLIAFLDSDDLWMPHKLQRLRAMADAQPDAVMYCHNLYRHINGAPTTRRFREAMVSGDVFGHVKRTGWFPVFVPTSGLAFPRWVLEKVLPIPAVFRTCADGYLTRTSMIFGRIVCTDECCGYYRQHAANNVLGSTAHNGMAYRYNVLLPALNKFYARQKIKFRFATGPRWRRTLETQARRVLHVLGR